MKSIWKTWKEYKNENKKCVKCITNANQFCRRYQSQRIFIKHFETKFVSFITVEWFQEFMNVFVEQQPPISSLVYNFNYFRLQVFVFHCLSPSFLLLLIREPVVNPQIHLKCSLNRLPLCNVLLASVNEEYANKHVVVDRSFDDLLSMLQNAAVALLWSAALSGRCGLKSLMRHKIQIVVGWRRRCCFSGGVVGSSEEARCGLTDWMECEMKACSETKV